MSTLDSILKGSKNAIGAMLLSAALASPAAAQEKNGVYLVSQADLQVRVNNNPCKVSNIPFEARSISDYTPKEDAKLLSCSKVSGAYGIKPGIGFHYKTLNVTVGPSIQYIARVSGAIERGARQVGSQIFGDYSTNGSLSTGFFVEASKRIAIKEIWGWDTDKEPQLSIFGSYHTTRESIIMTNGGERYETPYTDRKMKFFDLQTKSVNVGLQFGVHKILINSTLGYEMLKVTPTELGSKTSRQFNNGYYFQVEIVRKDFLRIGKK